MNIGRSIGKSKIEVNPYQELKKVQEDYEEICERIDNLNDEAFRMEQDMMYWKGLIKDVESGKIQGSNGKANKTIRK